MSKIRDFFRYLMIVKYVLKLFLMGDVINVLIIIIS